MKQLALGQEWVSRRLKAVRFGVINLPGRVVRHARTLVINLSGGHPSYTVLVAARRSILALPTARRGADPALVGPKATKTGPGRAPKDGLWPEPAGNGRPYSPCSFQLP